MCSLSLLSLFLDDKVSIQAKRQKIMFFADESRVWVCKTNVFTLAKCLPVYTHILFFGAVREFSLFLIQQIEQEAAIKSGDFVFQTFIVFLRKFFSFSQ